MEKQIHFDIWKNQYNIVKLKNKINLKKKKSWLKTLESPLDSKEIKPVHPKGNQSWVFTGRTGAEAEAPILWPPDVKS